MAEDLPVFDDQWVASARHHELSVAELKKVRRSHRRANRRRKARRVLVGLVAVGALAGIGVYVARTPGNASDIAGDTAGIGGSAWIDYGSGPTWYVSGILYIDRTLGDDPVANQAVILHELGHVLGLNHVDDPTQLMYPESRVNALGTGDLAGLAQVGTGDCAGLL